MSVSVHRLNSPAANLGNPSDQCFLVDLRTLSQTTPQDAIGFVFSLGYTSDAFTTQLSPTTFASSERFTTNTTVPGGLSNPNTVMYMASQMAVNQDVEITINYAIGGSNFQYLMTPGDRAFINAAQTIAPTPSSPGQLQIEVNTSATNSGLNDTFVIYQTLSRVYMYTVFNGFRHTYLLADPEINKDYILIGSAPSPYSYTLSNLNANLEVDVPEETPGGFLFRVVAQTANAFTLNANDSLVRSSDVVMVAVYKIDTVHQGFTYRTLALVDDSVHPLTSQLAGTYQLTGTQSNTNFLLLPTMMTVGQLQTLSGFGSFVMNTPESYYFKTPSAAMFPTSYANNGSKVANQALSSFTGAGVCFPFAEYDITTTDAQIIDDITTYYSFFNVFTYINGGALTISINGVDVGSYQGNDTGTNNTPLGNMNTITFQLIAPLNRVVVRFTDINGVENVVSTVFRLVANGTTPTTNTYFNGGVWFSELATSSEPAAPGPVYYSYVDPTATLGYTDEYGNYVPAGTVVTSTDSFRAGPKLETLVIGPTAIARYGAIQGFYAPPSSTVIGFVPSNGISGPTSTTGQIEFGTDGWIRTTNASTGRYTLSLLTTRGHVQLTLEVSSTPGAAPISTEYTIYTLSGVPVDLYNVIGPSAPTTYGTPATPANPPYIADGLLYSDRTIRFQAGDFVFNIVVLPMPGFLIGGGTAQYLQLKVLKGASYDLSTLVGMDSRISSNMFYPLSSETPSNPNVTKQFVQTGDGVYHSTGVFTWGSTASSGNEIWLGPGTTAVGTPNPNAVKIAVLQVIDVSPLPSASSVIARVGDKFNLWNYIDPFSDGSVLTSVQGTSPGDSQAVSSLPDGTITVSQPPSNGTSITFAANVVMMGVSIQITNITILILNASAQSVYMTRDATFNIPLLQLTTNNQRVYLVTNTGRRVRLRPTDGTYNGDDVNVVWDSTKGFTFSTLIKAVLLTWADATPSTYEVALNPIGTLSNKEIYAVVDSSGNATLSGLPAGPQYDIFNVDNTYTATGSSIEFFYGGEFTFAPPAGKNDFVVEVPEYNSPSLVSQSKLTTGPLSIPLRLVKGTKTRVYVVESNTVSGVNAIVSPKPDWCSSVAANVITITKIGTASETDTVTLQMTPTGTETTGSYEVIEAIFLPKVDTTQTILYISGQTYGQVLPSYGYDYSALATTLSKSVADAMSTVIGASPIQFTAAYGELSITFNMRLYSGSSSNIDIYLTATVPGDEVFSVGSDGGSFSSTKPIAFPFYTSYGLSITQVGTNVVFTKNSANVSVGEWFVGQSTTGSTKLITFTNLPAFAHPDVFIYDTTAGNATWTTDDPFATGSPSAHTYYQVDAGDPNVLNYPNPFGFGQASSVFAFVGTNKSVSVDAYYGPNNELIKNAFSIYLESGTLKTVHVVGSQSVMATDLITDTITSFTIDPESFTNYTGTARLKTTNVRLTISTVAGINTMVFQNDRPNSNDGERSTFYIKTATSMYIIEAFTHDIPYANDITIEIYDDFGAFPGATPVIPFDPNIINMVYTPVAPNTQALPSSATPTTGIWTVAYDYYNPSYTGGSKAAYSGNFTLNLAVIAKPVAVTEFMILKVGVPLTFNVISDYYGGSLSTHRLDGVNVQGNPITIGPPSAPGTFQSTGEITVTGTATNPTAYVVVFTVSVNPSRVTKTDSAAINTRAKNVGVGDVTILPTISFFVYDPTSVVQFVLNAFTGVTNPVATFNLAGDVGATVQYVEYNGQQLTDTHNNGFDWTTMTAATLKSSTSQVNNYFIATQEKGISLVTTVILPANPPLQTIKNSTVGPKSVDLLSLFFPTLAPALIDAGLYTDSSSAPTVYYAADPNVPTNGYALSGFAQPAFGTSVAYTYNGVNLSTFNLSLLLVSTPVAPAPLTFTIPINKKTNVSSADVNSAVQMTTPGSPQYTLTLDPIAQAVAGSDTALYATNDGLDGIDVEFSAPNDYSIGCLLTNQDFATLSIQIGFVAYDPSKTVNNSILSYSGSDTQTLPSQLVNYSVDGVNFGTTGTQFVTIGGTLASPTVTMTANAATPRHVFIFTVRQQTTDPADNVAKNVIIYNFAYLTISPVPKTIYLIKGQSAPYTAQQLTNASPNASIAFNDATYGVGTNGAIWDNDAGTTVGYITGYTNPPNGSGSITLVGNEPGTWDNFVVDIIDSDTVTNVGNNSTSSLSTNPPVIIPITVITLPDLLLNYLSVYVFKVSTPFFIDLNPFIVNKMPANFTNWLLNGGNVPVNLSSELSEGVITGSITTVGTYQFTGTITSQHHAALTSSFSVNVVIYDPTTTTPMQAFVEGLKSTTLTLTASVASVDGTVINVANGYKDGNVQFTFSGSTLTLQALTTLSTEIVYNLVLTDGSSVLLTLTQTSSNADTVIAAMSYTGQLFNATRGTQVITYVIQGQSGTYNAGTQYTLPNGGQVQINADGTFTVTSPAALTFVITYGGSSTGTVNLIVQGNTPSAINVDQPSYQVSLPTGVDKVLVNGAPLAQAAPLVTTYATFTWAGTTLSIDNISLSFQKTQLQIEAAGANVQVLEYTLQLTIGANAVQTLQMPTNYTASFTIPFVPVSITYGGSVFRGSAAYSDIIVNQTKVGSFVVDGSVFTVTSGPRSVYTRTFEFTNTDKTSVYYIVNMTSAITPVSTPASGTLTFPTAIAVVGDGTSQVFPTPSNVPLTLSGKLTVSTMAVTVLATSIVAPYTFYVTLADGTFNAYVVDFQAITIYVPNLTKFPALVVSPTTNALVFANPGVSVAGSFVLNPASLGELTMTSPILAKITVRQA